jgi:carbonic anhydrase
MIVSLLLTGVGGQGVGAAAAAEAEDGGFLDGILQLAARQAFHTEDVIAPPPSLDLSHLLSLVATQPSWYAYEGSLSRPPCTEGVQWLVSPSIIPLPRTLLDQLKVINGGKNARPVQPLDGRRIELYVPSA